MSETPILFSPRVPATARWCASFRTRATPDEWRKCRRALVSLIRQRLGLMMETPDLPAASFSWWVADPPWQLNTGLDAFGGTGERARCADP